MAPAKGARSRKNRPITGDLGRLFKSIPQKQSANPGIGTFMTIAAFLFIVFVLFFYLQPETKKVQSIVSPSLEAASPPQPVELAVGSEEDIFNITPACREQYDNFLQVHMFLYHPEQFGLRELGLTDISFTENEKNWFMALGCTESKYHHFDPDQNPNAVLVKDGQSLITSEAGCVGIYQGCNLSICPMELWSELKTNIYCGAKLFRYLLDLFPGNMDLVLASYKGAVQTIDTDGDGVNETTVYDDQGRPVIDQDLFWQVQTVKDLVTIIAH
ncbi:MAG TPA: lytic transglycosylase domain-containing protein [Candidatus Saccharimonadales bacterium]|nr:lytic transglycosylase domain-containing protein [Candidatus Saccharimonadales bacterium]